MGKAHSNAYCQAPHFYDLPYRTSPDAALRPGCRVAGGDGGALGLGGDVHRLAAAIDRPDIDAIDIALPNHLHAPAAIAAAEAGKMVFCEKPLALSVDEAQAMVARRTAACRRWSGSTTGACPPSPTRSSSLTDGRLGTIFHYNAAYKQQWGADTSRAATWRMDPDTRRLGRRRRPVDAPPRHRALPQRPDDRDGRACPHARARPGGRRCGDGARGVRERQRRHVRVDALRHRLQEPEPLRDPRLRRHARLQSRAPESSRVRRRHGPVDRAGTAAICS